jgi:FkbM family methyltransferase
VLAERARLTPVQQALVDIVLMSRCSQIAGPPRSAFSGLAAILGATKVVPVAKMLGPEAARDALQAWFAEGSARRDLPPFLDPMLARDRCWYVDVFGRALDRHAQLDIIEDAIRLDPEFCGAWTRRALLLAMLGDDGAARRAATRARHIARSIDFPNDPTAEALSTRLLVACAPVLRGDVAPRSVAGRWRRWDARLALHTVRRLSPKPHQLDHRRLQDTLAHVLELTRAPGTTSAAPTPVGVVPVEHPLAKTVEPIAGWAATFLEWGHAVAPAAHEEADAAAGPHAVAARRFGPGASARAARRVRTVAGRVRAHTPFRHPSPWVRLDDVVARVGHDARTVLEIGANDGTDTHRLLEAFPHATIHCFEPDPRALALLRDQGLGDRVRIHPSAVGAYDGVTTFFQSGGAPPGQEDQYPDGWHRSGSIRAPKHHLDAYEWCRFDSSIEIPIVRLDTWAQAEGVGAVDFIWADVQGAEGDMVAGGPNLFANTRFMLTEYSDEEMYEGQATLRSLRRLLRGWRVVIRYRDDVLLRNTRA